MGFFSISGIARIYGFVYFPLFNLMYKNKIENKMCLQINVSMYLNSFYISQSNPSRLCLISNFSPPPSQFVVFLKRVQLKDNVK